MKKFSSLLFVLLLMFASFTAGREYPRGDVDLNGEVNIGDLTTLIDYLLTGYWPGEQPLPTTGETFTVNGVSFTMMEVEGGTFTMGATAEQSTFNNVDATPVHEVTLSSYMIGQTEVTQALWKAVMGADPNPLGFPGDPLRPVEMVSWNNCQTFLTKLNKLTGKNFRLPTEAEWEFAARGGNYSQGYKYSGSNNIYDVGWYYKNAAESTHTVALKLPNELGLYDMSGNVSEWCQDWWGSYSSEAQTDPTGPETGTSHVYRGGDFHIFSANSYGDCRVSCRWGLEPQCAASYIGLRLAL